MRRFSTILLSLLMMGSAQLVFAGAAPTEDPATKSQGVENMSDEGAVNSNSPATGDQVKGQDRADARQSMDKPTSDKPAAKAKKSKSSKKEMEKER